ncbi:MAG: serine/threonine protein kinase [Deltaproteobacteria bacterium]|nr:serine/threonine protein kinase [Deltaproteobacteria bacterium]
MPLRREKSISPIFVALGQQGEMMQVAIKSPEVSLERSLVGRKLGRYEILAKIASGGMASVYVARAQGVAGFERLTAIKVLHANLAHEEEFVKMFLDEARLAARIRHPNVVATLDISDTLDAGYYLVMEYIEGDHVGKLLSGTTKAGVRLEIPVVLRIISDVLSGLSAAHNLADENGKKLNLVHRDISPHNIMVGVDGISRLTDFGIAKAEDRLSHTRDGQIKGKLGYMAPEHASKGISDARSDLFSVGIILWECLTYKRLFRAETAAESLRKVLFETIPPPSSVHQDFKPFDGLLNKALARKPERRFQSADEFAEAIETIATNHGGTASLRKIGKIVQKYASARIEREKALIRGSIQSLRATGSQSGSLSQSTDDPVSDASIKSSTEASTLSQRSKSAPSSSGLSLRSGVQPLPEPTDMIGDSSANGIYSDERVEFPSQPLPVSRISNRTKWLVTIAVFWCLALTAIAIWTTREEPPNKLRIIDLSPSSQPLQAEKKASPVITASPEKSSKTRFEAKKTARALSGTLPESRETTKALPEKSTIAPDQAPESLDRTTENESSTLLSPAQRGGESDKQIQELQYTTSEKRSSPKSKGKTRYPSKKQSTLPQDLSIDELPSFNPYLNTK